MLNRSVNQQLQADDRGVICCNARFREKSPVLRELENSGSIKIAGRCTTSKQESLSSSNKFSDPKHNMKGAARPIETSVFSGKVEFGVASNW